MNTNNPDTGEKPPFSYLVKVAQVSANPVTIKIEADADEREGLARLWQVVSVGSLKAELQINRWKRDGVRIRGRVTAQVVQSCIVTLEPVESRISEDFEQLFVPEGSKLARTATKAAEEMVLDPDAPDLPEPFIGDTIDAGIVVTEYAALSINPYPRKKGVEFKDHIESDPDGKDGRPNPFAVLKDWKKD